MLVSLILCDEAAQLCLEGFLGKGITSTGCSFQLLPAPFDHRDKYLFVLFFCHRQPHFKLLRFHFKIGKNVPPHKHLQIQINAQRQIFPLLAPHCLWLDFLVFLHAESHLRYITFCKSTWHFMFFPSAYALLWCRSGCIINLRLEKSIWGV